MSPSLSQLKKPVQHAALIRGQQGHAVTHGLLVFGGCSALRALGHRFQINAGINVQIVSACTRIAYARGRDSENRRVTTSITAPTMSRSIAQWLSRMLIRDHVASSSHNDYQWLWGHCSIEHGTTCLPEVVQATLNKPIIALPGQSVFATHSTKVLNGGTNVSTARAGKVLATEADSRYSSSEWAPCETSDRSDADGDP
jgi:hypothetical protein